VGKYTNENVRDIIPRRSPLKLLEIHSPTLDILSSEPLFRRIRKTILIITHHNKQEEGKKGIRER